MSENQISSSLLLHSLQWITITCYIKSSIKCPRVKQLDKILKYCIPLPRAVILDKYTQ